MYALSLTNLDIDIKEDLLFPQKDNDTMTKIELARLIDSLAQIIIYPTEGDNIAEYAK